MSKRSLAIAAAGVGGGTDPNFKNTTLLLQGDVSNPDLTYNAFSDASSNNFAITPNGDAYGSSFSPYNTSWSNYFDGTGDYLDVSLGSTNITNFGTGDFTVEFFMYYSGSMTGFGSHILDFRGANNGAHVYYINNNGVLYYTNDNSSGDISLTTPISYNSWAHYAICRQSGTLRVFKDGVQTYSAANTNNIPGNTNLRISGRFNDASGIMNGYLSNIRIVKGRAVYTSNFTPPTSPLGVTSSGQNPPQGTETSLLTCQSNRFIDNSSNNFAITRNGDVAIKSFSPFTDTDTTTGSGYFDGSGDWLYVPNSSQLAMAGDFTIEFWVYPLAASGIYSKRANASVYAPIYISVSSNQRISFSGSTTGSSWTINPTYSEGSLSVPFRAWNHIAVVRNGTTFTAYINGVADPGATFTGISGALTTNTSQAVLGAITVDGNNPCNGYIQNFRITNAAVYTGNFTPPTGQLATSGAASAASYPSTTNVNTSFASSATSLLTLQTRGATQNIGFVDSSPNKFPITKVGNTTQGTFSPYGNLWSNYFDGTGDYLATPSNSAFAYGTGDWTAEAWIYPTSTLASMRIFEYGGDTDNLDMNVGTTGTITYYNGSTAATSSTAPININAWNHIACVRSSGVVTVYVNGVSALTQSSTPNTTTARVLNIGGVTSNLFTGYISNVRIVKGTALYTSNFSPSTTPLTAVSGTSLLTCQSNRFKDNSSNNFTLTVNGNTSVQRFSPFNPTAPYSASTIGGSGYFDGTGDYLQVPTSTSLDFGTGDFTVEAWVNIDNSVNPGRPDSQKTVTVFSTGSSGSNDCSFAIYGNTSTAGVGLELYQASLSVGLNVAATVTPNSWVHVAWVRSGTTFYGFVNGVRYTLGTSSASISSGTTPKVGSANTSGYTNQFKGNISNLRVVKGTAVYTVNFTPPTAPLTPITNTSLLLNFTNAGIPDAAMMNDLETVGNAQVSTSVKKYGTGSLYFDGTGDYLLRANVDTLRLGSGDFTVEAWVNPVSISYTNFGVICGTYAYNFASDGDRGWGFWIDSVGKPQFYMAGTSGSGETIIAPSAVTANTWTYIAVTRNSGTLRLFVNGTLVASQASTKDENYALCPFAVGTCFVAQYGGFGSAQTTLNGYIDDLRITKGLARYTSNFTPPTQSLPKQ